MQLCERYALTNGQGLANVLAVQTRPTRLKPEQQLPRWCEVKQ